MLFVSIISILLFFTVGRGGSEKEIKLNYKMYVLLTNKYCMHVLSFYVNYLWEKQSLFAHELK